MFIYVNNETTKNVVFIRKVDLMVFNSKRVSFNDIKSILYYNVASEDLLDWLSYQRAMEFSVFGKKFTELHLSQNIHFAGTSPKFDMTLLTPKLDEVYRENRYYDNEGFYFYKTVGDTIVILNKNDALSEPGFEPSQSSPINAIYRSILTDVGFERFYFNDALTGGDAQGIDLAEFLAFTLAQ